MDLVSKDALRKLFNTKKYLQVNIQEEPTEPPTKRTRDPKGSASNDPGVFSPTAAALLAAETPYTRGKLAAELQKDDAAIQAMIEQIELDDPNYRHFNTSDIGIKLEYWVCVNMTCPGCNEKLYKYEDPSMPAVDVRCINSTHTPAMGPKFYQIKTTLSETEYKGYRYFNQTKEYICIGSKRFGTNCHIMKPNDSFIDILIGYICIEYKVIKENIINIINSNSFILIPNLLSQIDENYYEYIDNPHNITVIRFNSPMFEIRKILSRNIPSRTIDLNVNYISFEPISSPAFLKYLIMKKKYLDLKKLIFSNNN